MRSDTSTSVREIFRLTVPQLGLMLCHLTVSMTDIWVAGQIDSRVLATLGFISQLSAMLMLLISVVGSGCMATVSQSLGAGLGQRANRYAGLIVSISFLTGCLMTVAGLAILPAILDTDAVPHDMEDMAMSFGTAYAMQVPFYYSMIMLNSVFRAHKMVWLPFVTLMIVTGANFVGSVGLGLGCWGLPTFGYPAVAWSTFISALLGFCCNVAMGIRQQILRRDSFAPWRWNRIAAPRLWKIGAPAALGNLASHLGGIVLLALVAGLPYGAATAIAGMTLGVRIMGFMLFPLGALGMTITILSGHLLGARHTDTAYDLGRKYSCWVAGCMSLASLFLVLLREPVARLFSEDVATVSHTGVFLLFACCALPFQAVSQVLNAVLAGAGATRYICLIGCISIWLISIPAAWLSSSIFSWGASGIYASMTLGNLGMALWTIRVFKQKQWLSG